LSVLVVLNERAKGRAGLKKWPKVRDGLRDARIDFDEVRPDTVPASDRAVADGIARGHDVIVAAGGDGTVGAVLNAIMDPTSDRPRGGAALGAIGLGSSNDFHKPDPALVAEVPVRVARDRGAHVDVGKAKIVHRDGSSSTRYFLLNASMGIVAAGNAFFNAGQGLVGRLKRWNTEAAILYSALYNLATYQPIGIRLSVDGEDLLDEPLMNVGVLKTVHFAGGMKYDTPVARDDGQFAVNAWQAESRLRVLKMIAALYRGKFAGRPHTRSVRGQTVRLTPSRPTHLELDGEIFEVASAELSVVPRALWVCG
jgi:diacylglycerol kinase family enzyme